jgi:hypothetical protein
MGRMQSMKLIGLEDLGVITLRGPDVVRFLQGQLSADVEQLRPERSVLGGYHNPQGRVIALLRLLQLDAQSVLAVVPRDLAAVVVTRLSKYVLRAKVRIAAELQEWRIGGLLAAQGAPAASAALQTQKLPEGCVLTPLGESGSRWLLVHRSDHALPPLGFDFSQGIDADPAWRRTDIAEGLAQVYGATSEQFVAQMLNLDALGVIAFDKGCYTGQEVIARAHYRGRVKRRMQRFVSRSPCQLSPGDSGVLQDGRSFKVVLAAPLEDGRSDFLAVAALPGGTPGNADAQGGAVESAAPPAATVCADPAPLPYSLPE